MRAEATDAGGSAGRRPHGGCAGSSSDCPDKFPVESADIPFVSFLGALGVKHLLTGIVCLVWLGMAGLLVWRQQVPEATRLASLPPAPWQIDDEAGAGDGESWFGVYQESRKIGHVFRRTTRVGDGHRFVDRSRLRVAVLGSPQTIQSALVADTDADFAVTRFHFSLVSPAGNFAATGRRDGGRLHVEYGTDGAREVLELPLDEPIHLMNALRPRIAAARPSPGARYVHDVFNPLTMTSEPVVTVVEGEETIGGVTALRIAEEHRGLRERTWLAEDGRVLREEGMLGFTLVREPREVALGPITGAPVDVAEASRIPLTGRIEAPREREALRLRLGGAGAASVPSAPPRQRVRGDVLEIVREPLPARATPVPADGTMAAYLAPAPFIESDDPDIAATAAEIVGDETDPLRRARRLLQWVHRNMTQAPSVTVPSARAVLRARRGDCNEHAVLLTALGRAAGIPSRVVAGAVYLQDGFYYHAWTEFWLGDWVSADAVFAQMPADATHVRLVEGGPEQHVRLAEVVGRLTFTTMGDAT